MVSASCPQDGFPAVVQAPIQISIVVMRSLSLVRVARWIARRSGIHASEILRRAHRQGPVWMWDAHRIGLLPLNLSRQRWVAAWTACAGLACDGSIVRAL